MRSCSALDWRSGVWNRVGTDGTVAAFSGRMIERDSWKLFGVCVVLAGLLSVFVLDPLLGGREYLGAGQSSSAR